MPGGVDGRMLGECPLRLFFALQEFCGECRRESPDYFGVLVFVMWDKPPKVRPPVLSALQYSTAEHYSHCTTQRIRPHLNTKMRVCDFLLEPVIREVGPRYPSLTTKGRIYGRNGGDLPRFVRPHTFIGRLTQPSEIQVLSCFGANRLRRPKIALSRLPGHDLFGVLPEGRTMGYTQIIDEEHKEGNYDKK
jgi:hypothetical protein